MNIHRSTTRITRLFGVCALQLAMAGAALAQTPPPGLSVPGFGPGVAGNVSLDPVTPDCALGNPCIQPMQGARVQVRSSTSGQVVAVTVTNEAGNFIVSVPPGDYHVDIETLIVPRCSTETVTVGARRFALVDINCTVRLF